MQIKTTFAKFLHPAGLLNFSGHFRTVSTHQEAAAARSRLAHKSLVVAADATTPRRHVVLWCCWDGVMLCLCAPVHGDLWSLYVLQWWNYERQNMIILNFDDS